MVRFALFTLLALFFLPPIDARAQSLESDVAAFESRLQQFRREHHLPGLAATIVKDRKLACVSDGVQSLIAARYPEAIFLPVETTGDGKVNVQSRVQMVLFKAHQRARAEFEDALRAADLSADEAARRLRGNHRARNSLHFPPHRVAGTAANQVLELGTRGAAAV